MIPGRTLFPTLLVALLFTGVPAFQALSLTEQERARASELFGAYREAITEDDREGAGRAIKTMIDELPGPAAAIAHRQILADAQRMVQTWVRDVEGMLSRNEPRALLRDPAVVADRALLESILNTRDQQVQKRRLAEEGWPAIERLQSKLLRDPRSLIESNEPLRAQRDCILFRLSLCADLARHAGIREDNRLNERIEALHSSGAGLGAIGSAQDRRVLAKNEQVAERSAVPEADVIAVADANRLRMLAGLPALELDPGLCKGSLIHSKDMAEHNFFAHESPVRGRHTPWDRAREAGTTANAENIAQGYRDGPAANRGWFHSPGHFVNLFGDFRRIGVGGHDGYWTQLFGN